MRISEHHIISGKMAGSYKVDLASFITPELKKELMAVLTIDEDNTYALYFHVIVDGQKIATQNLAVAIRVYETEDFSL